MSKTHYFFLALAVVWLTAWGIAGYFMNEAGVEALAHAEHLGTPATNLEPGAEVRVEGTLVGGSTTSAPFSRKPCLAAVTDVAVWSTHTNVHGKVQHDSEHLATLRAGPPNLEIAVGDRRLQLPLDQWMPRHAWSQDMAELPAHMEISPDAIARAQAELYSGYASGFSISETTIDGGTHVFVAGVLEDGERLAPDRMLGKVVLHPGSQDDCVESMRGGGGGLRIAGAILGFGLGPLPLAILGLVLLRRRLRATE